MGFQAIVSSDLRNSEKNHSERIRHVLVVDDSRVAQSQIKTTLEQVGIKCTMANSGRAALKQLKEWSEKGPVCEHIAMVISDIEMPRMDGYELATHVRNNERLKNVPIIMITSRTGDKHRQRAMDIGVQKYLGKPYNESELLAYVQDVVK